MKSLNACFWGTMIGEIKMTLKVIFVFVVPVRYSVLGVMVQLSKSPYRFSLQLSDANNS